MNRSVVLAAVPVAAVAVIAGIVSFSHIAALGMRTGQSAADAHLLPLAVDGLIVAGSVILLAGSVLGWLGVVPGVAATLFANLESGLPHGGLAAVVATWPAVAFTVASFMLERWLKSQVARPDEAETGLLPDTAPDVTVPAAGMVPADAESAAMLALRATHAAGNPLSQNALMSRFSLTRAQATKVRRAVLAESNGHAPEDSAASTDQ